MGHIMRCVAFAAGLKTAGLDSIFVTKSLGSPVADVVRSNQFDVVEIPADVSTAQDSESTLEVAAKADARFITTDICHRDTQAKPEELITYHRTLAASFFTVCVTGDKLIDLPANVLVTPYVGVDDFKLPDMPGRSVLLGPSYFIFRPEFIKAAKTERTINPVAQRVLVTVGGSDNLHLTDKIIRSICLLIGKDLSLQIVIGAGYTDELKRDVAVTLEGFNGDHRLLAHETNMADAMLWADLAITGDGLTKYEAAATGTPCIILSRHDSEMSLTQKFKELKTGIHVGDGTLINIDELANTICSVLEDSQLRSSMSVNGKTAVDVSGIERILYHVQKGALR